AQVTFDDVLPFISVWMPVKFAQCARFEIKDYAGNRSRNRKSRRIDAPFAPAFEHTVRRIGKHLKFVRLKRRNARSLQIFRNSLRRNTPTREVNLLVWKAIKC